MITSSREMHRCLEPCTTTSTCVLVTYRVTSVPSRKDNIRRMAIQAILKDEPSRGRVGHCVDGRSEREPCVTLVRQIDGLARLHHRTKPAILHAADTSECKRAETAPREMEVATMARFLLCFFGCIRVFTDQQKLVRKDLTLTTIGCIILSRGEANEPDPQIKNQINEFNHEQHLCSL